MNRAVAEHYLRESRRAYFEWQSQGGLQNGEIEAHKFADYIKPEDVVLDFGCGGGFTLAVLHCARRIGVEPYPHACAPAVGNNVELYSSLEEVPDGVADVGISNQALEHVPYPIEALSELKTKIRRGARWSYACLWKTGESAAVIIRRASTIIFMLGTPKYLATRLWRPVLMCLPHA